MTEAIVASMIIALLSLSGVVFFGPRGRITGTHRFILPAAVGVFLGVVLFELIPETIEMSEEWGPATIAVGFLGFYLLSHFLRTYHHHHGHEPQDGCVGTGARLLLVGDAIHNFSDGIVIATAFLIDPVVGVAVTIGVALHEIPQEIAEYGVLVSSGYSKKRAALFNLLSASTVVLGTATTLLFIDAFGEWVFILTGIAAGNLLYIATADLLPELVESHTEHFWKTFVATAISIAFIGTLIHITHEQFEGAEEAHDIESVTISTS